MTLLVTGGAGFIGSNFIHYILDKYPDYQITNLDSLTYAGNLENLKNIEKDSRYKFIQGDIGDGPLVNKILSDNNIDIVVHFAAESHVDRSIGQPDIFLTTNILGTANLLKACLANGKVGFHHVSTDEVFGALGLTGYFDEHSIYDPHSPYSASKAASDHLVRAYFHTYGLPVTISNCSNNYGPYQHPEKFIPLAITNLIKNKKIPVYGKGENVRDWLFVTDHCRAIDLIIHGGQSGETYCIGGQAEFSNIDVARKLAAAFGRQQDALEFVTDRPGHDFRYAINPAKIMKELGWQPTVSFEQGLAETINWYKTNEDWWKNYASINHW